MRACVCEKGTEDEKAGGKSEGICGQACLEGEERECCMQKLMPEGCEHVYEGLTPLCIPKPLQVKTQPVQRFAALGAQASALCLQHISVSLEASVLLKHNQRALTWPRLYEAAGSSTRPLPQFRGGDCRTSSWTPRFPALVPVASQQHFLNPKTSTGDMLSQFEKRGTAQTNKEMSQRAIETWPWE